MDDDGRDDDGAGDGDDDDDDDDGDRLQKCQYLRIIGFHEC